MDVTWGTIRNGISSDDRCSSSHSKTHRAAMGFSFRSTGRVQRAKECWNESRAINGSTPAAKTKEKLAEVTGPFISSAALDMGHRGQP